MPRFEELLHASREQLASLIASLTARARDALHATADDGSMDWLRKADRLELVACQEALARIGPGGFSAALHSLFCERLDQLAREAAPAAQVAGIAAADKLTFALKEETEVEEEIECARLIQLLESGAESTLRELRTLCATLRDWHEVRPDAPPLHPQACAAILLEAVRSLRLNGEARRILLRAVSPAMAAALIDLYASQVKLIKGWGVKPAKYTIRLGTDARAARASASGSDDAHQGFVGRGSVRAVLQGLMQQAGVAGSWGDSGASDAGFGTSTHEGSATSHPGPHVPADMMADLLRALPEQWALNSAWRGLFEGLEQPGQRLANAAPEVWQDHAHPWWELLERLAQLCETNDGQPADRQTALAALASPLLSDVNGGMGQGAAIDGELCLQVLQALDAAVAELANANATASVVGSASSAAAAATPSTDDDPGGDEEEANENTSPEDDPAEALSHTIREQMSRQIGGTSAPLTVRRFLQGPWVRVLAKAMDPETGDLERAQRYAEMVDQILAPSDVAQPTELSLDDIQSVIHAAREALEWADLPPTMAETHVANLAAHLSSQEAQEANEPDPAHDSHNHAALPTVPVELHALGANSRARRDRTAWLGSLRAGDRVRLFLDAQWMTLQLIRCDEAADMYQFKGRGARPGYCLTRGALERLRAEGLATTVDLVN